MANRATQVSRRHKPSARLLATTQRLGLRYIAADALSIRRRRCGKGWIYFGADKRLIRDPETVRRLSGLAVPPAYHDVLYASDPAAHLQAIGRDAAGRLQYRYHPKWEQVRELDKARRLARLAAALPRIRRSVAQHLRAREPTRELASAAVIETVWPGRTVFPRFSRASCWWTAAGISWTRGASKCCRTRAMRGNAMKNSWEKS